MPLIGAVSGGFGHARQVCRLAESRLSDEWSSEKSLVETSRLEQESTVTLGGLLVGIIPFRGKKACDDTFCLAVIEGDVLHFLHQIDLETADLVFLCWG